MRSLSIYRPEDEALLGLLDDLESTQPDTVERSEANAAIARWLSSGTAITRVDTVCSVLAGMEAQIQGVDTQLMRLRQAKHHMEHASQKIRTQIAALMADFGIKRMAGTAESLVLHTNPPAVQFTDEGLVPDEYKTLHVKMTVAQWNDIADLLADTGNDRLLDAITTDTPAPQKALIKSAIKADIGVPGAFMEQAVTVLRK